MMQEMIARPANRNYQIKKSHDEQYSYESWCNPPLPQTSITHPTKINTLHLYYTHLQV
jgi:hypothetical protein